MSMPSVGRIVHYVSHGTPGGEYGQECRAAIVTEAPESGLDTESVSLAVVNPGGFFFNQDCRHSEGARTGGTWHWPERV